MGKGVGLVALVLALGLAAVMGLGLQGPGGPTGNAAQYLQAQGYNGPVAIKPQGGASQWGQRCAAQNPNATYTWWWGSSGCGATSAGAPPMQSIVANTLYYNGQPHSYWR